MKRVRVPDLKAMKAAGRKISVLTAYDFTMARLLARHAPSDPRVVLGPATAGGRGT